MEREAKEFSNESSGRFKRQQAELGSLFSLYPALNTWYQIDENQPPYLPPDFHGRLAIHIMILMEKHTSTETIQKVSELLQRHINGPKMYVVLFKVLRLFTHKIETAGFLTTIWRAMLSKNQPDEQSHFQEVMRWMVDDYTNNRLRNFYTDEERKEFKFSFLAFEMGDHLISLYDTPAKNIDLIREIYTTIIDIVFENVSITEEIAKKDSMLINGDFSGTKEMPYFERLIFSDIYDYVEYRTTSSGQNNYHNMGIQHSSESIKTLLRQLASIRVQYTQSLIREKTVQRNQELKKKLERKNLSEEEMITCTPYFSNALRFFYLEKRYNFDVYNISLARYFLQFFTVFAGSLPLLYSFIDTDKLSLIKGFGIFLVTCLMAQLLFNKKYFRRAFPSKNYLELENFAEQFLFYFQKMMPDQLRVFGVQQIKMADNKEFFPLIPEFLLFLYKSIPKKDRALVSYLDVININQYLTSVILHNLGPEAEP